MTKSNEPKVLVLDIETAPGVAYVWNPFDDFVPLERLIKPGYMLCFAAQFAGEKKVHFAAIWQMTQVEMLTKLTTLLNDADAVVTFNGDKFDLRKIRGEVIAAGVRPFAPLTSIDLYKTVKGLGYWSGKLEYVGPLLDVGKKKKHAGFSLWRDVMNGCPKAREKMKKYNIQDIKVTGRLYKKLRPYIGNHPVLRTKKDRPSCSVCGSTHVQSRGHKYTRSFKTERWSCMAAGCGHWDQGKRTKR